MKRLIWFVFCCALGLCAMAQSVSDPVYGKGAVTETDGIVTFRRSITSVKSDSESFESVLSWAKGHFAPPIVKTAKAAKIDNDARTFTFVADEMLVFKSTAFLSDEAEIIYTLNVTAEKGAITVTMSDIAYRYDGMSFKAEDWITDKESINKSGTKFLKTTKKFRVKTIDLYESICTQIGQVLTGTYLD